MALQNSHENFGTQGLKKKSPWKRDKALAEQLPVNLLCRNLSSQKSIFFKKMPRRKKEEEALLADKDRAPR